MLRWKHFVELFSYDFSTRAILPTANHSEYEIKSSNNSEWSGKKKSRVGIEGIDCGKSFLAWHWAFELFWSPISIWQFFFFIFFAPWHPTELEFGLGWRVSTSIDFWSYLRSLRIISEPKMSEERHESGTSAVTSDCKNFSVMHIYQRWTQWCVDTPTRHENKITLNRVVPPHFGNKSMRNWTNRISKKSNIIRAQRAEA